MVVVAGWPNLSPGKVKVIKNALKLSQDGVKTSQYAAKLFLPGKIVVMLS